MPGREIPEFREKAGQVAKASIYDLRIHHDDVLLTILFRH
jgi:acyl-[acyl-carrier-protein] desaturase